MKNSSATRVVILTNGNLDQPELARAWIGPGDRIVCADAGALHAIAMGLMPDVVVGDLDSLSVDLRAQLEEAGVRFVVHPVRKDQTDLELALQLAIDEGATHIDLMATMGGRLDQSLANLLLLTLPTWEGVHIRVIEGAEVAWVARGEAHWQIDGQPGDTLSLVPLTPLVRGVSLEGVEWPLDNATLHLGSTLTISNMLAAPRASLHILEGLALVVHRSGTYPPHSQ
jgi:thiamine pyrophosphokinase